MGRGVAPLLSPVRSHARLRGRKSTGHAEAPQEHRTLTIYGSSRDAIKKWFLAVADKAQDCNIEFDWEAAEPEFFRGRNRDPG